MKSLLLSICITLISYQINAQQWITLFDGQTTQGWHSYGQSKAGAAWKVVEGALTLDPTIKEGRGDIVTDESFNDFHLQLEWKIAKNGNSGIIFFVQDDRTKYDYVWHTGPEMQVLDNDGHPDAKINKHRVGDLYDLVSGTEGAVKPVGEWNRVDIINEKGKLTMQLNDVTTVSIILGDENWEALIKKSKFASRTHFGKIFAGHISLQDHGDLVSFRNIRIRKL